MSIKRSKSWIGDRGYPTKTRDDVAPHGIVPVETTTRDSEVTGVMERNDLLSSEYFPATGQGDADRSVNAREQCGLEFLGPIVSEGGSQARDKQAESAIPWPGTGPS